MSSIGSHVLHRRALDAVSAGLVVLLDADRRIADWNTAAGAVLGLRRDAVGHDHGTLFGESLDSAFAAALANGHTVAEATMVDAEGRRSRRRFRVVALHDEGNCVGYAIHGEPPPVDDEVVQLRRETRSCRALLREIVDDVWCSDASGRTTRMLETRTAPMVDAPHDTAQSLALLHPDDRAAVVAATQQALQEGRSFTVSARGLRTDGSYRHLEIHGVPVRDADGTIQDWIGATVDVHEARLAEERDRESRGRLSIAVDAAPMSAWSLDPETWSLEIIARGPGWGPGVGPGPVSFAAALDAVHPDERRPTRGPSSGR